LLIVQPSPCKNVYTIGYIKHKVKPGSSWLQKLKIILFFTSDTADYKMEVAKWQQERLKLKQSFVILINNNNSFGSEVKKKIKCVKPSFEV